MSAIEGTSFFQGVIPVNGNGCITSNGVGWAIPGATVDWQSLPGNLLPPGFSLTRASNGTYFDSAGLLQTAATNVTRGTYRYNGSAWVFDGTMNEQEAANVCLRSNAFTTTPWAESGTTGAAQNVTGPDGQANSAWTLTDNDGAALEIVYQGITLTAAQWVSSVFVKKTAGAQASYPVIYSYSGTSNVIALCTIDTSNGVATAWTAYTGIPTATSVAATCVDCGEFWRISLTHLGTATSWQIAIFPAGTTNATQSTGVLDVAAQGSVVVYGYQVELGSSPTSYIATGAASATRNADVVTAPTSGLLVNAQGFAAMGFRSIAQGGAGPWMLLASSAGASGVPLYFSNGFTPAQLASYDGAGVVTYGTNTNAPAAGAVCKVATSWGGSVLAGAMNGVVGTPSGSFDGNMNFGATLQIGEGFGGGLPYSMVLQSMRLGVVSLTSGGLSAVTQ